MNILFINPPNILGGKYFGEYSIAIEPVDILSLASYMETTGHSVDFIDMDAEQLTHKDTSDILELNTLGKYPKCVDLVVIPYDYHIPLHSSESIEEINKISACVTGKDIPVIICGKTASAYPDKFIKTNSNIYVINGQAELPLKQFCSSYSDISSVKGLFYYDGKSIKNTGKQTISEHLDNIPICSRKYANMDNYIDVRTILTSRGCANNCDFCPTKNFWGSWRGKSPENVIDEINYLITHYNSKKILFLDDNAIVDNQRMTNICNILISNGIKGLFGCLGSVNYYNEDMINLMYKAGFRWIHYGVESGSQRILDEMGKGITIKQIKKAFEGSKKAGLRTRASIMLDYPSTTNNDLKDTFNLIKVIKPDELRLHYLSLRAGSSLADKTYTNKLPYQYIHSNEHIESNCTAFSYEMKQYVNSRLEELQSNGYKIVYSTNEWRNVSDKDKFVSLCPARYGINWKE